MRILIVTSWFEPDSGAASARFSQLAHYLASQGHDVTVLAPMPHHPQGRIAASYRGAWTKEEMRGQVRVVRVWLWASPSPRIGRRLLTQLSFMIGALLRGCRLPGPDLLLIESQPVPTALAGMLLARWLRAPYVLSVSDLWPDHLLSIGAIRESHLAYRLARRVVDAVYRGARAIVTISPEWERRIAARIQPAPDMYTIYFMTNLQRLRPDLSDQDFRSRHGLTDLQIVACIGTFATQYDFDILLQAARRLEGRENLRFLLIGDGSQRAILQDLGPNLQHVAWLPREEVPAAWAAADVSCFATREHELYQGTLPARLHESLASGTPVVAACAGESAGIIRESGGGIAVAPGDVEAFTDAIVRMLDDEDMRQRCGRTGRAWARENIDVELLSQRYEQILLRVAGTPQRRVRDPARLQRPALRQESTCPRAGGQMRILVVTSWFEPDSGAASARFSQLAHFLASRGHDVTVLAPMPHHPQGRISKDYRGAWTRVEMRGQVRVVRVWLWASPSPRIRRRLLTQLSFMIGALLRGCHLRRPDVLLIESQPVPTGLAGMLLARWLSAPYVLSVSDLWPDHLLSIGTMQESNQVFRLARRVVNRVYRGSRVVVTISPEITRWIAGRIPPATELHTILFMVNLQRLRPDCSGQEFRTRHNLCDMQIVACIGTFATAYDFTLLLETAKLLENRGNLRFLLVGDGSQREKLRDLEPNVQYIAWLPHDEVPAAWSAADISFFALRDHWIQQGALPARLYETLATGTPVVAACAGESARIIRESGGGIAVSPGDVEAFTDAIVRMLDDEDMRQRCGRAGRAWAENNIDVEVLSRRYEQILLKAAGKKEAT